MVRERPIGVITFGIFLITLGLGFLSYCYDRIIFGDIFSLLGLVCGGFVILLGLIKFFSPVRYEMSPGVTLGWGILIVVAGISWHLFMSSSSLVISLESQFISSVDKSLLSFISTLVATVGFLAVIAGMRGIGKKMPRMVKV